MIKPADGQARLALSDLRTPAGDRWLARIRVEARTGVLLEFVLPLNLSGRYGESAEGFPLPAEFRSP